MVIDEFVFCYAGRTIAIVTDGSGKWYDALEENLIERHLHCERKDVHLDSHSEDLSEYIYGILSDERLEWFYVVWRDSLEKKTKVSLKGTTNGRLWRLVSELKWFPLPDDLRRKVVLVQIGAPSTVEPTNHVLTIFIRGLPGNGSEEYSGTQAANDIYKQMKNRDGERIRERERDGQSVPNGLPHLKRLRSEHGSKSLPPCRRVRGQTLLTNGIRKSVANSTEDLPQSGPDPPVENGGLESGAVISELKKITSHLDKSYELQVRQIGLHETAIQIGKEALAEKRKTNVKIEGVADTAGEILDLSRHHSKST